MAFRVDAAPRRFYESGASRTHLHKAVAKKSCYGLPPLRLQPWGDISIL